MLVPYAGVVGAVPDVKRNYVSESAGTSCIQATYEIWSLAHEGAPRMAILIVEPGTQSYKERFLRELTNNPYEFFLLVNSSPRIPTKPWYYRYIPHTRVFSADFRNIEEAVRSARKQLTSRGIKLSGVTTYYEDAVLIAQAISEELSLIPITTGDPLALRNKNLMRRRFSEVGLPQPQSILCRTHEEAERAVEQIGIPCVIKPSQMGASIGVRKLSSRSEDVIDALNAAFTEDIPEEDTRFAYNIPAEVLVEEYIPTYQEVSCEGVIQMGNVHLLAITKKSLCPEPLFEEIGHATPYQLTNNIRIMLEEQLRRASHALKLHSTAFHAEFRLRQGAPPVLIELGARLPGGFIPQLVQLSQGINMLEASLHLAIGQECKLFPQSSAAAAIRFLLNEASVRKFDSAASRIRALPFVDELAVYESAGVGRWGHVIWTAYGFDELEANWSVISEHI